MRAAARQDCSTVATAAVMTDPVESRDGAGATASNGHGEAGAGGVADCSVRSSTSSLAAAIQAKEKKDAIGDHMEPSRKYSSAKEKVSDSL